MVQGIRIRFPYFRKEVKKKNSSNDRLREAVAIRAG